MSADAPNPHDLVEDLVFQCLEGCGARGPSAIEEVLAGQPEAVCRDARRMLATLLRVGLTGDAKVGEADGPEQLGPYRLLERIGAGAMGVVYRARRADREDSPDLALKLLQPGLLPIRGTRVRFQREVAALRELDHAGICPVLDAGEIDGVPFLAMPFVPGESLRDVFARGPAGADAQRREQLLKILQQVALALHHAHERGFVHRDVKPANVIVRRDGQPVLLDFGLARLEQPAGGSALTASGGVVGTPAYMAPEQVAGRHDVDRRCDVYALGAVLYEGLTGRLPHEAPTRESLYRRILTGEVTRPSRLLRDVPTDLDVVCLTALERDAGRRYQTANDFASELQRVQQGLRPVARLPGPWLRTRRWIRRNPLPSALMGIVLLASSGLLLQHLELRSSSRTDRARAMAADAMQARGSDPDRAIELALAAHEVDPVPETLAAIQAALAADFAECTLTGHQARVTNLAFAAGGARLASVAADGTARIWDLAARASRVLEHGGEGVAAIACQPGGDLVVTSGRSDGRICAFSVKTGQLVWARDAHPAGQPVSVLQWSPDGRLLLTGGGEATGRVWNADGVARGELPGEGSALSAGAWFDSATVMIGSGTPPESPAPCQYHLRQWRLPTDKAPEGGPQVLHAARIVATHPHPTRHDRVLVVTTESVAYLWKLGDFLHPLRTGVINKVEGAGWSPDGTRAFTCATGGMVRTWSCDGEQLNQGDGPDHIAISVANPTKPWFAVCGEFGNLMVMTYDCRSIGSLGNRRLRGEPLAFSSDGNLLAAATWPGEILVLRVWDPALPLFVTGDRTMCGAWSHAGRTIVTGGGWTVGPPPRIGGGVKTWDVTTGLLLDEIDLGLQVIGLFPDPSGERLIATQGRNNRGAAVILQRGPDTWKQVRALPHSTLNPYAWHAQFASDDQVLLVDHGGRILQWELTTNNVSQRLPATDNPGGADSIYHRWLAIATTPDRSMVWAGGTPGYLHRFDRVVDDTYVEATPIRVGPIRVLCTLPDGSLLVGGFGGLLQRRCTDGTVSRFAGHRGDVLAVDWATLDGEILVASVDRGGFVRLWRADGTLVREVRQLDSGVCSVRFSPDGTRLLTTNELGAARIWPVRTADLLALARKRVSR